MKWFHITQIGLVGAGLTIAGCEEKNIDAPAAGFDAAYVAAEANGGNLEPLKELNAACSAEIRQTGKRLSACKTQDAVRKFSTPIDIRF